MDIELQRRELGHKFLERIEQVLRDAGVDTSGPEVFRTNAPIPRNDQHHNRAWMWLHTVVIGWRLTYEPGDPRSYTIYFTAYAQVGNSEMSFALLRATHVEVWGVAHNLQRIDTPESKLILACLPALPYHPSDELMLVTISKITRALIEHSKLVTTT